MVGEAATRAVVTMVVREVAAREREQTASDVLDGDVMVDVAVALLAMVWWVAAWAAVRAAAAVVAREAAATAVEAAAAAAAAGAAVRMEGPERPHAQWWRPAIGRSR
jgi:hypothetical protein